MSHPKPFGAAVARDAVDPALDTEEMTDEQQSSDGAPLMANHEDLFDAPPPEAVDTPSVEPEDAEQDTAVERVPEPESTDAVVVDDEGVLGELPPPSLQDVDLSVGNIVARAERTDDYLRKWRTTSVDRSADWEAEEAVRMELEARRRGWFYLGAAGGVTVVLLGFCGMLATGMIGAAGVAVATSAGESPATAEPVAEGATSAAVAVEAPERGAAPLASSNRALPEGLADEPEPVEAPIVEAAAVAPAPPVAPVVPEEPAPEPSKARVVLSPPGSADGVPTVLAEAGTWNEGRFRWAGALVAEEGVELAWFDANGTEVLDRVACSGRDGEGYRCLSGRSPKRIAWALEQGAERGLWTVKACRDGSCVDLGTTQVD